MAADQLILASGSPRRRELLARLGLDFTVHAPDIDERRLPDEAPDDYVRRLAVEKAATIKGPRRVVIAADTAVIMDGEVLGKPADRTEAESMLIRLRGRGHEVLTGVAVRSTGTQRTASAVEQTVVELDDLSTDRLGWYLDTGEGADKAGAYGLQGAAALFADRVTGSVTNVVGLPLPLVDRLCTEIGVDLLTFGAPR